MPAVAGTAVLLSHLVSQVSVVPDTPVNLIHSLLSPDHTFTLPAVIVGAVATTNSISVGSSFLASVVLNHVCVVCAIMVLG